LEEEYILWKERSGQMARGKKEKIIEEELIA
jgi:hypothetical protein